MPNPEQPAEETSPAVPRTRPVRPLNKLERGLALAVGLSSGGAGGYAVFESSNQVGSAALILTGAAFLLVAVQGTRLVRLEGAGNSIEMADAAEQLVEVAKREPDADRAEGMIEAAAIISPRTVASAGPDRRTYTDELHRALRGTARQVSREVATHRPGRPLDFVVEFEDGRKALVEAKARRYGPFTMLDVHEAMLQVSSVAEPGDAGLLIVTNAPLAGEVQEFNAQDHPGMVPIEVITWNDERDNGLLARSLQRVAR
ncbi:hypothetical protein [Micromonospora sp. NPDC051141]|uniref:hypothetical protein n=1 Tax=Micromonospora sp. NPDC051141 TaxID=3364284 RepID=UPI00378A2357